MVERRIINDTTQISYSGLFNVGELYSHIDSWVRERAYTQREKKKAEKITESEKHIEYEFEPFKKVTDYATYIINVVIKMDNVKEVVVEKSGTKVKMNKGDVTAEFMSFLELDYEHRWEKKPAFYFIRALFDHFIYKVHTERLEPALSTDTNDLISSIKSFLNLNKH